MQSKEYQNNTNNMIIDTSSDKLNSSTSTLSNNKDHSNNSEFTVLFLKD